MPNIKDFKIKMFKNKKAFWDIINPNINIANTNKNIQIKDKKETNERQVRDKLETNERQIRDKLETNERQIRDKLETNKRQNRDKLETKKRQNRDKLETKKIKIPKEVNDKIKAKLHELSGIKEKIMIYIVHACCDNKSLTTYPLNVLTLSIDIKEKNNSVKKVMQRLKDDSLIVAEKNNLNYKGHACYKVSKFIKSYIKKKHIIKYNIHKNIVEKHLPKIWISINYESLKSSGFIYDHIVQIYNSHKGNLLSINMIQNSIDSLDYDLRHNDIEKYFIQKPIILLISILKKGIPYYSVTPDNYHIFKNNKE